MFPIPNKIFCHLINNYNFAYYLRIESLNLSIRVPILSYCLNYSCVSPESICPLEIFFTKIMISACIREDSLETKPETGVQAHMLYWKNVLQETQGNEGSCIGKGKSLHSWHVRWSLALAWSKTMKHWVINEISLHRNVTLRQEDQPFVCHLLHTQPLALGRGSFGIWVLTPFSQKQCQISGEGSNCELLAGNTPSSWELGAWTGQGKLSTV